MFGNDDTAPWIGDTQQRGFYRFGNSFYSVFRTTGRQCMARLTLESTKTLVLAGKAPDLFDSGLPSTFDHNGASHGMLYPDVLDVLIYDYSWHLRPVCMSEARALELALLAVAIHNYKLRHRNDPKRVKLVSFDTVDLMAMLVLVKPELVDQLLVPNEASLTHSS